MRTKKTFVLVAGVLLLSYGMKEAVAERLIRTTPGTTPEYYQTVTSAGLGDTISGNILTGASGGKLFVADFDDDGYDEMYQVTDGNEYYVDPTVQGASLVGTQTSWSGVSPTGLFSVGNYIAGDTRDYMIQHVAGSSNDYLRTVNSDASVTNISVGNIDTGSTMPGAGYFAGDYDGDGTDEIFAIHDNNQFMIDAITNTDGVLSSTNYAESRYFAVFSGVGQISGYFVDNNGADQLLRIVNDAFWSGADQLFSFYDEGWVNSIELGAANIFADIDFDTEDLVVGDFDDDGYDELLVVRNASQDWLYDDFTTDGGVLDATLYTIDAGSPSIFNNSANFVPEPATISLLGLGCVLALVKRRKL